MIWQDTVIMVCNFVLIVALIPSLVSANKPAKLTCLMTSILVGVIAGMFAALDLWLSTAAVGILSLCWFALFLQRSATTEKVNIPRKIKVTIDVLLQIPKYPFQW